jgi:hypothetical protein
VQEALGDVDAHDQQQQQVVTPLSAVSRGSSTPKAKRSSIKRLEEVATCVPFVVMSTRVVLCCRSMCV